ncbi:dihydrofolate reductase, partial [Vibrio makurazakiensis]
IPVLLGGGSSLFGDLAKPLNFKWVKSESYLGEITQNHFVRVRG